MPELVTSIVAAFRGESDLALGNVVGSNIFNCLVVLPASGLINQIAVPSGGLGDVVLSWSLAALLIPIFYFGTGSLGRKTGTTLLIIYFGYAVFRISGSG
jgi:cation:H+ antiporter